jgi:type IV pilus assembly protein PilN
MPMIEINLLPEELRRRNKGLGLPKAAQAGIAGLVIAVALMASVSYYQKAQLARVNADVTRVEAKVRQMQDDIQLVDRLVDVKTRIMRRLGAIETLDRNRAAWVQNMEDLATVIPQFLWLSEFQQGNGRSEQHTRTRRGGPEPTVNADSVATVNNTLTLKGYSYTVSSLANFILNLQDSPRFSNIQLSYARAADLNERHVYDFQVVCHLEPIDSDADGMEDGAVAPKTLGEQTNDDADMLGMTPADEEEIQ